MQDIITTTTTNNNRPSLRQRSINLEKAQKRQAECDAYITKCQNEINSINKKKQW